MEKNHGTCGLLDGVGAVFRERARVRAFAGYAVLFKEGADEPDLHRKIRFECGESEQRGDCKSSPSANTA